MITWLASYPRSGNTLLRQVLYSGWGILSGSTYENDLGDNIDLIRATGHVELKKIQGGAGRAMLKPPNVLVKTHKLYPLTEKTIYIMRDGRAASVSLWHFLNKEASLDQIIRGKTDLGRWSEHIMYHFDSSDIVMYLKYEEFFSDPQAVVATLSEAFGEPLADPLEPLARREDLSQVDGKWVRPKSDWREHWTPELDRLFQEVNAPAIARFYPEMLRDH